MNSKNDFLNKTGGMGLARIHYIDTVKGVGILFVIMGHHWLGADALRGWISSFHMPLFFMITGFLLANRNKIYKNVKQLVNEKARTLLYPVCPAKLDHTSRCKSGHSNRQ